jgi:hypothetical protein
VTALWTPKARGTARTLGLLAVAFSFAHAAEVLFRGAWSDLLWLCNIASLLLAAGCLWPAPALNAVGVSWLFFGVWLWLLDLLTGGELMPTSILTHVGSPVVGVLAARRLGWPRGAWWKAVAGEGLLIALTRLLTPEAANVNLAFRVWQGWEERFPNHTRYLALLLASTGAVYFVIELLALRLVARREPACAISSSTR